MGKRSLKANILSSLPTGPSMWGLSQLSSVQFSSVSQSCPILCDPMNCSTLGLPVHHQLPSLPKPMFTESVMPSNHLILCCPLLLLSSILRTSWKKVRSKGGLDWRLAIKKRKKKKKGNKLSQVPLYMTIRVPIQIAVRLNIYICNLQIVTRIKWNFLNWEELFYYCVLHNI